MVRSFFYGRDDVQFGPFDAQRMRALALAGQILPTDSVWQADTTRKVSAASVKGLFQVSSPTMTDLPAATAVVETPATEPDAPDSSTPVEADASDESPFVAPTPPAPVASRPPVESGRKKRIISIKGGVLVGQDGISVQFRKKCSTCNKEDSCRSTATIRVGCNRVTYFCRICRKARVVEMQGIVI